ncbi:MAG: ImmA/IrrE family metallo-endopeptidase [Acidobacteria bacterium]|nr:ImmA/IrrE family metallo-endopeptidase [Acidobacteriota bacterium]
MRIEPVVGIQPTILQWARESLGMSVEDVALKLKRSPEEILAWESGAASPTYVQLEALAYNVFKRPLAVFFLPKPPEETTPTQEFRTLPDTDLENLHADTYLKIRRAQAYQLTLKELFEGRNPSNHGLWREIRLTTEKPVDEQAQVIRLALGISLEQQTAWKTAEVALKVWREVIEQAGIFVFKASFKQKEISGFCLRDAEFPVIYLNNSTTKTRQIFSLLHEVAHLLFNLNGISKIDENYVQQLPSWERRIEQFCNRIAAEVLIPSQDFAAQIHGFPRNAEAVPDHLFAAVAGRYGVSRETILRRLLDLGRVGKRFYEQKAKLWASQKSESGGGNWYASQKTYLSDRFAHEVLRRYYRNQLSVEQAADFLGIKTRNFAGLEQQILQGSTA